MKSFELVVDGEPFVLRAGQGSCEFNGRKAAVDLADLGGSGYSVTVDGVQHTVHLTSSEPGLYEVAVNGSVLAVQVRDPRRLAGQAAGSTAPGRHEVRAPMPGRVQAVHVSEGNRVERGHGLLIVEAMKMQNELRSPCDGCVVEVRVKVGDSVSSGDALVVVE